ncbi:MAG: hypothetical protein WC759_04470 [Candidatus Micrarchaeia archaeon]|jgi:hypothetical protein
MASNPVLSFLLFFFGLAAIFLAAALFIITPLFPFDEVLAGIVSLVSFYFASKV